MISITVANQNFSKVARMVDKHGTAVILKNFEKILKGEIPPLHKMLFYVKESVCRYFKYYQIKEDKIEGCLVKEVLFVGFKGKNNTSSQLIRKCFCEELLYTPDSEIFKIK